MIVQILASFAVVSFSHLCIYWVGQQKERKRCLDVCTAYAVEHAWSPERNHAATMIGTHIR